MGHENHKNRNVCNYRTIRCKNDAKEVNDGMLMLNEMSYHRAVMTRVIVVMMATDLGQ